MHGCIICMELAGLILIELIFLKVGTKINESIPGLISIPIYTPVQLTLNKQYKFSGFFIIAVYKSYITNFIFIACYIYVYKLIIILIIVHIRIYHKDTAILLPHRMAILPL